MRVLGVGKGCCTHGERVSLFSGDDLGWENSNGWRDTGVWFHHWLWGELGGGVLCGIKGIKGGGGMFGDAVGG